MTPDSVVRIEPDKSALPKTTPGNRTTPPKYLMVVVNAYAKATCGIVFSKQGISGEGQARHAERELLKLFQDRGIAVLVADLRKRCQEPFAGRKR